MFLWWLIYLGIDFLKWTNYLLVALFDYQLYLIQLIIWLSIAGLSLWIIFNKKVIFKILCAILFLLLFFDLSFPLKTALTLLHIKSDDVNARLIRIYKNPLNNNKVILYSKKYDNQYIVSYFDQFFIPKTLLVQIQCLKKPKIYWIDSETIKVDSIYLNTSQNTIFKDANYCFYQ